MGLISWPPWRGKSRALRGSIGCPWPSAPLRSDTSRALRSQTPAKSEIPARAIWPRPHSPIEASSGGIALPRSPNRQANLDITYWPECRGSVVSLEPSPRRAENALGPHSQGKLEYCKNGLESTLVHALARARTYDAWGLLNRQHFRNGRGSL